MKTQFVNQEAARHANDEIAFSFGANWGKYVRRLDNERINRARDSLLESFGGVSLAGEDFIDLGCGSGLFSLCAAQLGARRITSIDIDPNSIRCTNQLRASADYANWRVVEGSALDQAFLTSIQPAARLFSWGVLHHTGAMWSALENALTLVAPGGLCCIALYNRPRKPALMLSLKRIYNRLPVIARPAMRTAYGFALLGKMGLAGQHPIRYVREYGTHSRGMTFWRDVEDWLGGLPCEFAEPEEVCPFVVARGFQVERVTVRSPAANNEYLFRRVS